MKLKVLKGLAGELCMKRKLRNVYETNRAFKAASLYTFLKNETGSGKITITGELIGRISESLQIGKSSVYNYMSYAQDEGLLTRIKSGIVLLHSYTRLCNENLLNREFITLEIDPAETKLEYALKALEYQEAKERMIKGLEAKVRNNPHVRAAFALEAIKVGMSNEPQFNTSDLFLLQKHAFAAGGSETIYDTLFIANPDLNRNLHTIAWRRRMKSHVSACYERKRLAELNLLQITTRTAIACPYRSKPTEGRVKGRAKNRRRVYDAQKGQALWYLPSRIEINTAVLQISSPEALKPAA
jgi:hypothetical protein